MFNHRTAAMDYLAKAARAERMNERGIAQMFRNMAASAFRSAVKG